MLTKATFTKRTTTRLLRAATVTGLCLYAVTAQAQFNWKGHAGSGTGNWGDNGSWSGGSHPGSFSATALFNAKNVTVAVAQTVNLTGGPFAIGIITVNTNVQSSLTFTNGSLTLGGPAQIDVQTPSPITFDPTAIITGTAGLNKTGPGTLILSGTNTYTGPTNVTQGTLLVTQPGSLAVGSSVTVASGATLGGTGIANGSVNIASGGILAPGVDPVPGTLTVGPLTLNSGSMLNYQYGIPSGLNDLVNVMGNLTLAGTLNVTDVGGFGPGVYRVFNYTGSLTNNILNLGSLPSGFNFRVDTSIATQVNLVVSGVSLPTQFWDGINKTPGGTPFGRGGTATWNNVTTNTNWTTQAGTSNAAWGSGFAVFAGTAGTVTLGDNIHFTGMQFLTDGYVIQALGSQTLLAAPNTVIRADTSITATISAPIGDDSSGPAGLTKTDGGTLILTGNNTYTGGTTISGGTLWLGNGGTTGSIIGNVEDNGTLVFDRSGADKTFDGVVSGSGSVVKLGSDRLVLTQVNTYSGGTSLGGGTLAVKNDGNLGTGRLTFRGGTLEALGNIISSKAVILFPGGTFLADAGTDSTLSGTILGISLRSIGGGGSSLTKVGDGILRLTGTNSYGITTVNGGVLTIQDGGIVSNSGSDTLGFAAGDTGTMNVVGPGSTLADFGDIVVGNAGTGTLTISNAAVVTSNFGTSVAGEPGSMGTLNVTGGAILQTLALQAGGGTAQVNFDNGILRALQNNPSFVTGFSGTELNLASGGLTIDDAGFTVSIDSPFTGPGGLTKTGSGTVILTADNLYGGNTRILEGTLQIGNGNPTANIVGDVEDNGTLVFNRSGGKKTFDGLISGSGSVVKLGSDNLELTASNAYGGGTTIESGILVVGTSNALGTGNVNLIGGILQVPSLDPLTIVVGGNFTQGPNGTLRLGADGTTGNHYDHVQAAGSASVAGTLDIFSLGGFAPKGGDAFVVVRGAGGSSGRFSAMNDFLNLNHLRRVDVYAKNADVLVYVAPSSPPPVSPSPPPIIPPAPGATPPPNPAGPSIEDQAPGVEVPPVDPGKPLPGDIVVKLLNPTAEQLTSLFEIPFSSANIQRSVLDDRMLQIQRSIAQPPPAPVPPSLTKETEGKATEGKAPPPPPAYQPGPRWGIWASGYGIFGNVSDAGLARGYRSTTGGMLAGVDYRLIDNPTVGLLAVGLFGGYSHTWADLRPGNIDIDTGRGGIYATYLNPTGWWVNVGAYGGGSSFDTSREALLGRATASSNGYEVSAFGDAGYDIRWGNLTFGPVVSMQFTTAHINSFSEQGSLVPLDIHSDSEDSLTTDLGAQATYNWHVGKSVVIPLLRLAWQHEFKYSNLPLTVSAPALGGATANVTGPNLGHESLLIKAGVLFQWTPRVSMTINYDGQVARDNYDSHSVTGTFSYSF